jgi:hypothetical protein
MAEEDFSAGPASDGAAASAKRPVQRGGSTRIWPFISG